MAATNLSYAAANLKSLAEKFKAIITLADELEAIGDLDAAKHISESNMRKVQAAEADVEESFNKAQERVNAAIQYREELQAKIREEAAQAKKQCGDMFDAANATGNAIIVEAKAKKDSTEKDLKAMQQQMAALKVQIEEARVEFASIQKNIIDTKARIAAI